MIGLARNDDPTHIAGSAYHNILKLYNSPLNGFEYAQICLETLGYPKALCDLYFGIMFSESRFATDRYRAIEEWYHNASGFKSREIIACHCPDSNGSWLRQFNSWAEFYRVTLTSFKLNYWDLGLTATTKVSKKWVGKYSQPWVNRVNFITLQL